MSLWKRIFRPKASVKQHKCFTAFPIDPIDSHEQAFIAVVINLLENDSEGFSAKWSSGMSLDRSVQRKEGAVLIMIGDGQIVAPISPKMTVAQKDTVKSLLKPIVKRDSDFLINLLISNAISNS